MGKPECKIIYAEPQKIPAKYKKFKLKDCSVPILRRKRPKKFEVEFWDERTDLLDTLGEKRVPDFTMRDLTKKFTNYKCSGTVKWITNFVYNSHKNYFKDQIVSLWDLTKRRLDNVAREFSAHVKPELRKHYIMACIAKDFDRYIHSKPEDFHDKMLVSYLRCHLRFKFDDPQEFRLAAMQYLCQLIIKRGELQGRLVLFSPYRIGSEGWPGQTNHEPLNYFIYEGRNFLHNGRYPTKEEYEEAFNDFAMFRDGIIIKTGIPPKKGIKRKFDFKDKNLSIKHVEKIPRARGISKKSETNEKGKLCENKTVIKRGKKIEQKQNEDLLKQSSETVKNQLPKRRGRPPKQKKLETDKEIFLSQPPKVQSHKRQLLEADKENVLFKRFKGKQRDIETIEVIDEASANQTPETCDESSAFQTPATCDESSAFQTPTTCDEPSAIQTPTICDEPTSIETSDEHASTESSDKHATKEAFKKPWTLWNLFDVDKDFQTASEARKYYYSKLRETKEETPSEQNTHSTCQHVRRMCSPYVPIIHC